MPVSGAAVQVTERTAFVAASRSILADQPGISSVWTEETLDRSTVTAVVAALVADSLGTWKLIVAKAPRAASVLVAWTCADADVIAAAGPRYSSAAAALPIRVRHTILRGGPSGIPFLSAGDRGSGQSESRHQVGVDLIELPRDCGVGAAAAGGRHVLRGRDSGLASSHAGR